jgi:probable O-glycosylation ligase (exosortase A-associated)
MVLSAISVLGTHSRGSMVGLAVLALAFLIKSRNRLLIGLCLGVTFAMGFAVMPKQWHDRMETILTYQEDRSMQGRFLAWQYAIDTATENPVVGGGFGTFRGNIDPTAAAGYRSAHSIYFEVLGEHGFPGLAVFLALGVATFLTGSAIIRQTRRRPDLFWARDLAAMVQVALAGYAVSGLALDLAFFDLYYHLIVIMVLTRVVVKDMLPSATEIGAKPGTVLAPSVARHALARPIAKDNSI